MKKFHLNHKIALIPFSLITELYLIQIINFTNLFFYSHITRKFLKIFYGYFIDSNLPPYLEIKLLPYLNEWLMLLTPL